VDIMTRAQRVLAAIILLWGLATIISGTKKIWTTYSQMTSTDSLIVTAIFLAGFAVTWGIYKAFFAQYLDPVINDSIASFQKNMGITKR
jgi:hypothetical protein